MEIKKLNIIQYEINKNGEDYIVRLVPEDNGYTSFQFQRKGYALINDNISFNIKELECSVETFIENSIDGWIELYNDDLNNLERG